MEHAATENLIPYDRNNRTHPDEQIAGIAESIKEFGFNQPIVIDETNTILVGHGRYLAAKVLGLESVPIVRKTGLSETQKRAYRILDNKLQNDSTWEFENLKLDLKFLAAEQVDLTKWGLDDLEDLFPEEAPQVSDDDYEAPEEIVTSIKRGDLIELGAHRVLCGDSGNSSEIDLLLAEAAPCIVFTDPPYGVNLGAKNRMLNTFLCQEGNRVLSDIEFDTLSPEELKKVLLPAFKNIKRVMADDCTVLVTAPMNGEIGLMMMMMMCEAGLPIRHVLIWKKNRPCFSMGRLDYDYQHEPIFLTWGKRHKRLMLGKHKTSVWEIDNPQKSAEHPTIKPIELVANALLNHSEAGDFVLDIFLGSGTTLIAADQLGRICYGMEIEPKYCQVIINRYKRHCLNNNKEFTCKINGIDFND